MVLGLMALLIAHTATVSETVSVWSRSETYKFAWIVFPTLAYLLWHNRRRLALLTPSASALGVFAAAVSGIMWIASDLTNITEGRQFAVLAAIFAVVLTAVGWSTFRALLPFLALLLFVVPTGRFLLPPLKNIAVGFAQGFAALADMPFRTDGFSMFVGTQRYVVIDYCAALPYVLTGLFLGLTLGLLIYSHPLKIALLALLGGGLAILANGLRIIGIITYDYATGSELSLAQHAYFELPALAASYGALFYIFSRLTPDAAPETHPPQGTTTPYARLKGASLVLLAVALVSSTPFIWQERDLVVADSQVTELLPATLSGWVRQDAVPEWQPRAMMKTVNTALATYEKAGGKITIFTAQTTLRRDKISSGAVDLLGDEVWMPARRNRLSACTENRCDTVAHSKLLLIDSDRRRHVYFVYAIDGKTTTSALEIRLRRAWSIVTGASAPARLVAIATEKKDGLAEADIAALIQDISHR